MLLLKKKLLAHPDPAEVEQLPPRLDQSNAATRNLTQVNMKSVLIKIYKYERHLRPFEPTARNGKPNLRI
jgi:hypothetical protein